MLVEKGQSLFVWETKKPAEDGVFLARSSKSGIRD